MNNTDKINGLVEIINNYYSEIEKFIADNKMNVSVHFGSITKYSKESKVEVDSPSILLFGRDDWIGWLMENGAEKLPMGNRSCHRYATFINNVNVETVVQDN